MIFVLRAHAAHTREWRKGPNIKHRILELPVRYEVATVVRGFDQCYRSAVGHAPGEHGVSLSGRVLSGEVAKTAKTLFFPFVSYSACQFVLVISPSVVYRRGQAPCVYPCSFSLVGEPEELVRMGAEQQPKVLVETITEDVVDVRSALPSEKIGTDPSWKPKVKYHMVGFMIFAHIMSFVGLVMACRHERAVRMIIEVILGWQLAGLGITVGAHRLWAHRTFKARTPMKVLLMFLNSAAHQGSIYHWSRDHRIHHKFSETDADPHNSHRGFFFSHMGWLLRDKHPLVLKKGKEMDMSDLAADPIVMFQYRNYLWLSSLFAYVIPALYTYFVHGDYWLGLFAHGFLRHVLLLHATWMVNSVAHMFGSRPYSPSIRPCESLLTALATLGEGWHNWHHTYPFDYAASEFGFSGSWNPSKLFIDFFCLIGQASDRKRATNLWEQKKAKLAKKQE